MRADAAAPAVLAVGPAAVMLADARAPAVLAGAPDAVMLADARAPAVLAVAPAAVILVGGAERRYGKEQDSQCRERCDLCLFID